MGLFSVYRESWKNANGPSPFKWGRARHQLATGRVLLTLARSLLLYPHGWNGVRVARSSTQMWCVVHPNINKPYQKNSFKWCLFGFISPHSEEYNSNSQITRWTSLLYRRL